MPESKKSFLENINTFPELTEQETGAGPSGKSAYQIPKIWIRGAKYNFSQGWDT